MNCTTYYRSPVGLLRISGDEHIISELTFYDVVEKTEPEPIGILSPLLLQCIEQLIEYFNGHRKQFDLPLSQQGTAFQQKVWYELMNIPYGST
ncbi:MAG TPA: cysteine methyltransferase, partial [Flavitalea sp.]|nr:cysteine methyltransferase [Flavitalea sp.]